MAPPSPFTIQDGPGSTAITSGNMASCLGEPHHWVPCPVCSHTPCPLPPGSPLPGAHPCTPDCAGPHLYPAIWSCRPRARSSAGSPSSPWPAGYLVAVPRLASRWLLPWFRARPLPFFKGPCLVLHPPPSYLESQGGGGPPCGSDPLPIPLTPESVQACWGFIYI